MTAARAGEVDVGGQARSRPPRWTLVEVLLLAYAVATAFVLRLHDMDRAPVLSDNQDEMAWAWSGLTLITRHVPYGWSYLPSYTDATRIVANGYTYPIVHPWFDHPPLFSLVVGGYAWLLGARELTDVTPGMIRPLAVALASISIALAYLLLRRVLGRWPATIAAILLATAPAAVLLGREVESEALLTPLLLVAMLLVARLLSGEGRRWTVVVLAAVCAAATLTKLPGFAVGVIAAAVLVASGRWRPALVAVAGGVAGFLLYAAYGAVIDWHQFTQVLHDQEIRRHGVMAAYEFIASPSGIGHNTHDGWWILGLLGIGALLAGRAAPQRRLLIWGFLVFSAGILVLADERIIPRYGWYRIPVYPLAYGGAAYLAWLAFDRLSVGAWLAVLLLGGASATTVALAGNAAWMPSALVLVVALPVMVAPLVAAHGWPRVAWMRPAARVVVAAGLGLMLVCNILASINLANVYNLF
jgi:4-amino-4-deoxy-L-arabinose transferase-like glycosyltransferase